MKTLGKALLVVTVVSLLLAVWFTGYWVPFVLTALITLFTGAAILGNEDKQPTLNRAGRRAQKRAQR